VPIDHIAPLSPLTSPPKHRHVKVMCQNREQHCSSRHCQWQTMPRQNAGLTDICTLTSSSRQIINDRHGACLSLRAALMWPKIRLQPGPRRPPMLPRTRCSTRISRHGRVGGSMRHLQETSSSPSDRECRPNPNHASSLRAATCILSQMHGSDSSLHPFGGKSIPDALAFHCLPPHPPLGVPVRGPLCIRPRPTRESDPESGRHSPPSQEYVGSEENPNC
jgi:hypothetical protein